MAMEVDDVMRVKDTVTKTMPDLVGESVTILGIYPIMGSGQVAKVEQATAGGPVEHVINVLHLEAIE